MPSPPTLFLDFDGVLHPNHAQDHQLFVWAPLLADALEGCQVDIVISSSWRFQWDLPHIRTRLPAHGDRRHRARSHRPACPLA
jgi:hypothetical protein